MRLPDESVLARLFFSRTNVETVQEAIEAVVRHVTGVAIDRQSELEVLRVMRAIYVESPKNVFRTDSAALVDAIQGMNRRAVEACVEIIREEMAMKRRHQADIEQAVATPLDRPAFVGSKGEVPLPSLL